MANLFKYLIDNDYTIYYKDTDSIVVDKPLPDFLVSSTELGKLKLEHVLKKGIFIAPKVYCLVTEDNQFIYKVKGLNKNVTLTLSDFESLLNKDFKLEREQIKWFKSLDESTITLKSQLYSLKVTGNKRELIYDSNNKFVDTKPFVIDNNKKI